MFFLNFFDKEDFFSFIVEGIVSLFVVEFFFGFLVRIFKEYNFFEEEEVVVGNFFINLDSLVFNFFDEEDERFY